MKNKIPYFVLLLLILTSCSKKNYTALYQEGNAIQSKNTLYYLSKNLLKLEVIYTLNEPRVSKNGIDEALPTSTTKITIEDPIEITKLWVPDPSKTFIITGKTLSDDFFVNGGAQATQSIQGEKMRIALEKNRDVESLPSTSFSYSNIEAEAYSAVLEMNDNIEKVTTKKEAGLALSIMSFYRSQFRMLNEDFKPYVKKSKLKYTIIIDPTALYSKEGHWSEIKSNRIYHTIFPKHIFKNKELLNTNIILEFPKPEVLLPHPLENGTAVEGLVYRNEPKVDFALKLNDSLVTSNSLRLAQLGAYQTISVKDFDKRVGTSVMIFKSNGLNKGLEFEEKIEPLDFDATESIEASQKAIKQAYEEKLKAINLLIKRLQERKNEL